MGLRTIFGGHFTDCSSARLPKARHSVLHTCAQLFFWLDGLNRTFGSKKGNGMNLLNIINHMRIYFRIPEPRNRENTGWWPRHRGDEKCVRFTRERSGFETQLSLGKLNARILRVPRKTTNGQVPLCSWVPTRVQTHPPVPLNPRNPKSMEPSSSPVPQRKGQSGTFVVSSSSDDTKADQVHTDYYAVVPSAPASASLIIVPGMHQKKFSHNSTKQLCICNNNLLTLHVLNHPYRKSWSYRLLHRVCRLSL